MQNAERVQNLISNAVKYLSKEQTPFIKIGCADDGADLIRAIVRAQTGADWSQNQKRLKKEFSLSPLFLWWAILGLNQ